MQSQLLSFAEFLYNTVLVHSNGVTENRHREDFRIHSSIVCLAKGRGHIGGGESRKGTELIMCKGCMLNRGGRGFGKRSQGGRGETEDHLIMHYFNSPLRKE